MPSVLIAFGAHGDDPNASASFSHVASIIERHPSFRIAATAWIVGTDDSVQMIFSGLTSVMAPHEFLFVSPIAPPNAWATTDPNLVPRGPEPGIASPGWA